VLARTTHSVTDAARVRTQDARRRYCPARCIRRTRRRPPRAAWSRSCWA